MKMMNRLAPVALAWLAAGSLTLSPSPCRADLVLDMTLTTSANLNTAYTGPFALDFTLLDGSGVGDNNNSVTISNIQFGPGHSAGPAAPVATGGASGDLSSSVVLTEPTFVNDLNQQFTPGNATGLVLTFRVDLTTIAEPQQDTFTFSILTGYDPTTGTGTPIPTTDPNMGEDALLLVLLPQSSPPLDASYNAYNSTDGIITVTATPENGSVVPEPATLISALIGVGLLMTWHSVTRK